MIPLTDISLDTDVTNTDFDYTTPTYSLLAKNKRYLLISNISINADSNFKSDGKIQARINGQIFTTQSGSLSEVELSNNLSLDFPSNTFVIVEPNSTLDFFAKVSTGSAKLQFAVTGMQLEQEEYELLKKKFLGTNVGGAE